MNPQGVSIGLVLAVARTLLLAALFTGLETKVRSEENSPAAAPPRNDGGSHRDDSIQVWIGADRVKDLSIFVDEKLAATSSSLKEQAGTLSFQGVTLRRVDNQGTIQIGAVSRSLSVRVQGFDGWQAHVAPGAGITLKTDLIKGLLEVGTAPGGSAPITLTFIDGARLTMPPGAQGKLDVLLDKTYVFSARVPDANTVITGRDGEGRIVEVNENSLPLTGGPFVEVTDPDGRVRQVHLSPKVIVTVSGEPTGGYVLSGGGLEERVGGGDGGGGGSRRTYATPNGALVTLIQDAGGGHLGFSVDKGDVRFEMAGWPDMQVVGRTGQRGTLGWSAGTPWLDVDNGGSGDRLVVGLPQGVSAGLADQGGGRFSLARDGSIEVQGRGRGLVLAAEGKPGWAIQVEGNRAMGLAPPPLLITDLNGQPLPANVVVSVSGSSGLIPEPTTLALLVAGGLGLAGLLLRPLRRGLSCADSSQ